MSDKGTCGGMGDARYPWPDDAPPGQAWKCPDCDSWATIGGNAGWHRDTKGHRHPKLVALEPLLFAQNAQLLRERTSAGLMDCKAALRQAQGNLDKAEGMLIRHLKDCL